MKTIGTKHTGIRYKVHESRKHGTSFDKYFYINYRYQGKRIEEGLGWSSAGITLTKAISERVEILEKIKLKEKGLYEGPISPEERKTALQQKDLLSAKQLTVADFVPIYIKVAQDKGKVTWKEDEQKLNNDVLPFIGTQRLDDVSLSDLNNLVERVRSRNALIAANRLIALLTRFFTVAVKKGYLEISHANKLEKTPEHARERVLSCQEIKGLWFFLDSKTNKRSVPVTDLIKILLLTGKRTGEVRQMKWEELDLDAKSWTIPREKVKNRKKSIPVYLSTLVLAILKRRKLTATSPYVFPNQRGEGVMTETVCSRFIERSPFGFRVHDLRRTVTTLLAEAEIAPGVIDRMLGHNDGSVRGRVYDQFKYATAQAEAWELLCWRIVRCLL